jgi:DNA-directed RNA polymerase subunit RPC12/RpoP
MGAAKKKLNCPNPECATKTELQATYGPDEGAYTCPACGHRFIIKRVGEYRFVPEPD